MKHKHADLIHAWADGAEIQYRPVPEYGEWKDAPRHLIWDNLAEYRIKPEPKPNYVLYINFHFNLGTTQVKESPFSEANLKLTFDGETLELKSAEVLSRGQE